MIWLRYRLVLHTHTHSVTHSVTHSHTAEAHVPHHNLLKTCQCDGAVLFALVLWSLPPFFAYESSGIQSCFLIQAANVGFAVGATDATVAASLSTGHRSVAGTAV